MNKLIELYINTNYYVNEAIERIIAEIHLKKQNDGSKNYILSGCEPGVGTTTMAINLAISMASAGWKTILIDGDLRKIVKYKKLNEELEFGLTDYLLGTVSYSNLAYHTNLRDLYYIPSGKRRLNPISLLSSDKVDELMDQLSKDYDYIIMDMPSITTSVDPNIMASKTDGVILVSEYAKTDIRSIMESRDILNKSGNKISGIILNKINKTEYGHMIKNFDYYKNQRYINKQSKQKASIIV
ncbi:MAG: tyrosine-protein kinase family protein [Anaerolineaceae bacterium]|nr:MAG: tyrosine-protein kinase family protein [Anaerolineaceae bacterium]